MKSPAIKTAQKASDNSSQHSSGGEHAIAITPPDYGIEFVDNSTGVNAPLQCQGVDGNAQMSQPSSANPSQVKPIIPRNNTGLPGGLKSGIESLSGISMDNVNVHYNSSKPAQLNALAYAQGNSIHLGPGQEKHLPHEAWHVVQQRQGRVRPTLQAKRAAINDDPSLEKEADSMGELATNTARQSPRPMNRLHQFQSVVQRRRVPQVGGQFASGLTNILTDYTTDPLDLLTDIESDAANFAAHDEGLRLVLKRAAVELSDVQKGQARVRALAGLSADDFGALPTREQLLRVAGGILAIVPGLQLGDPSLIDTGPRLGSNDVANILTLVTSANLILDAIALGTHDVSLGQIFGVGNVVAAKAKYAKARTWLNTLHGNNRIVTDRSGYSGEINLGGLTGFQRQISLSPQIIDNPNNDESVITLIHESTHAGNDEVKDFGYIGQPSFTQLQVATKLNNAAHYEVIPRRVLGAANDYAGQTFVPAGAVDPLGVVTPQLTPRQEAIREVSEKFRKAWTVALNLHKAYVYAHRNPTQWNTDIGGGKTCAGALPYWSKVEKLTIHQKADIDPASLNPSRQPVSLIDIALSEGLIRKLALGMNSVPQTEQVAKTFEEDNSTPIEMILGMFDETEFLLKLVLQVRVREITGGVDRDVRVVNRLAQVDMDDYFNEIYTTKDPASFAD